MQAVRGLTKGIADNQEISPPPNWLYQNLMFPVQGRHFNWQLVPLGVWVTLLAALFAAAVDPASVEETEVREVRAHGAGVPALLHRWLEECLYVHEIEGFVPGEPQIGELDLDDGDADDGLVGIDVGQRVRAWCDRGDLLGPGCRRQLTVRVVHGHAESLTASIEPIMVLVMGAVVGGPNSAEP